MKVKIVIEYEFECADIAGANRTTGILIRAVKSITAPELTVNVHTTTTEDVRWDNLSM